MLNKLLLLLNNINYFYLYLLQLGGSQIIELKNYLETLIY